MSLLLLGGLKEDSGAIADSTYWNTLEVNPVVGSIKSLSILLIAPLLVTFLIIIERSKRIPIIPTLAVQAILFSSIIATVGSVVEMGLSGFSNLIVFIITFATYVTIGSAALNSSTGEVMRGIYHGILGFSVSMIGLNLFIYVTGYGFVPGMPRMFGTTVHPNFLGVQMAICLVTCLHAFLSGRRLMRVAMLAALASGLIILFNSGSRTGFIMLGIGGTFAYWARSGYSLRSTFALGVLGTLFIFFLVAAATSDVTDTPFDRGTGAADNNTRAVVWAEMINLIADSPWIGQGHPVGPSENSLLRGWVAYGIGYVISLVVALFSLVAALFREATAYREGPLFLGLGVALIIGSMLEGYLVDRFSGPLVLFILISCVAAFAPHQMQKHTHMARHGWIS